MLGLEKGGAMDIGAIPSSWLDHVELRDELETLASDLGAVLGDDADEDLAEELSTRYPGW